MTNAISSSAMIAGNGVMHMGQALSLSDPQTQKP
jgi:hypothetical protein